MIPQPLLYFFRQRRQLLPFHQETVQLGDLFEDIVFIHGAFEITGSRTSAGTDAASDHALHHIDMPVPPGAQLIIHFQ